MPQFYEQEKIKADLDNKVKEKTKTVWIELTRRYLGYGSRHLRYLDKMKVSITKQQIT